ncbi:MAG: hypothetical protein JWM43_1099 [Acidobacteriaceae bacterium]|nr:hypothetical protein [Acidobacteriaceae bacterium]
MYEATFSSFGRRRYGGSDPACAFRSRSRRYLFRHRGSAVLAELLQLSKGQRKANSEIDPVAALQGFEGSRLDSWGTSRRRDAQYVPLYGDRETLSGIDRGDCEGASDSVAESTGLDPIGKTTGSQAIHCSQVGISDFGPRQDSSFTEARYLNKNGALWLSAPFFILFACF